MSNVNIQELKPGTIINNDSLCDIFACSTQGGMRRSHSTNTLVIVSNHIKSIYDDRWMNDTFHYTGMGTKGDQSLDFAQNKTLALSNYSDITVHLFEVFVEREYTYMGKVSLTQSPYFETQLDEGKQLRQVCVFPLQLISGNAPALDKSYFENSFNLKTKQAKRMSDADIKARANNSKRKPGSRQSISQQFDRDPWIAEYAKRRANGICQLCEQPAPFINKKDQPYLETHHIVWLAKDGEDTIENTVALCPNCHRKMHILNSVKDVEYLKSKNKDI